MLIIMSGTVILVAVAVLSLDLFDASKDTFAFTNYGFAVMAGFSSIAFSWERNISDKEVNYKRLVNYVAISSLYGGIVFLLGSGLKYIYVARHDHLHLFYVDCSAIIYWLSVISLAYGVLLFCFNALMILRIIDQEQERKTTKRLMDEIHRKKEKEANQKLIDDFLRTGKVGEK